MSELPDNISIAKQLERRKEGLRCCYQNTHGLWHGLPLIELVYRNMTLIRMGRIKATPKNLLISQAE